MAASKPTFRYLYDYQRKTVDTNDNIVRSKNVRKRTVYDIITDCFVVVGSIATTIKNTTAKTIETINVFKEIANMILS